MSITTDLQHTRMWWIDESRLAGSPNPHPKELSILWSRGFKSIICLLAEAEQPLNYDRKGAKQLGYTWYPIPIPDFHAPYPEQFHEFLWLTESEMDRGKVLVHCWGGSGRTGTMGAAYWIWRGWSAKEAIDLIRLARRNAVETSEQELSLARLEADYKTGLDRRHSP